MLKNLRQITSCYKAQDIYNMDETGLYWKATPERTLATQALPGSKAQKSRIILAVCGNADGSDKISLSHI
jgi:hypothetical protein